jgi:hypothetical protein
MRAAGAQLIQAGLDTDMGPVPSWRSTMSSPVATFSIHSALSQLQGQAPAKTMRVPSGDQASVRSIHTGCGPSSHLSKQPRIGVDVPNGAVVRTFAKVPLASAKASHLPSGDHDGPAVALPLG